MIEVVNDDAAMREVAVVWDTEVCDAVVCDAAMR